MAPTKSPKSSTAKTRSSMSDSTGIHLKRVKGENFYRNAKQASRLKMMNGGKPVRDRDGKIIEAAAFQKTEAEAKPGRVQPDKRWFGNTRVISQTALDHFRTNLGTKVHDPYSVLLRSNKLPMSLLDEAANPHSQKRSHIVETEPFKETFGPKAQRKRPRLDVSTFEELTIAAEENAKEKEVRDEEKLMKAFGEGSFPAEGDESFMTHNEYVQPIFNKGTSKRIYGELYKVIDSSDVILHILDARDPLGTLCQNVLDFVRKEKAHKQVVLVINKCDLVPNWVTARYVQHLTPRYPTIAFHASQNHSFGKGSLIQLLRQFSRLHSDRKQISVGLVGYPNVGKSSVINTLSGGKVCTVAPVPGETKVWQYITLTKRIYLIDCPGIVPTSSAAHDSQTTTVLKGVVRIEALSTPSDHIPALLARVKPRYISRTYNIPLPSPSDPTQTWRAEDLLDRLARQKGRLMKGGEPDVEGVARIVLADWVRGKIPFFVAPPERPAEVNEREEKERKAREREEKRVPGVTQKLGGIMQKNTFSAEDVRPLEQEEEEEGVTVDNADAEGDESDPEVEGEGEQASGEWTGFGGEDSTLKPRAENSNVNEEAEEEEEEEPLRWDDVYFDETKSLNKKGASTVEINAVEDSNSEASDAESDPDNIQDEEAASNPKPTPKKEPRMTTNKRKPTNFFSTANVKNKNRSKKRQLPRAGAGAGGGRTKTK